MKHLNPREAYRFLEQHPQSLWIDCRSESEFYLVGHPIVERGDDDPRRPELVVWADEISGDANPDFVSQVERLATHRHQPIILSCRSGQRSVRAGEALEAAGFTDIYNQAEGFEGPLDERYRRGTTAGWRFHGLPWEQL